MEIEKEKMIIIKDSVKNCTINCLREEPNVFLTPTSFPLFRAYAVLRFIKLIHASNRRKIPITLRLSLKQKRAMVS